MKRHNISLKKIPAVSSGYTRMVHTSVQQKLWFWKRCSLLSNSWSLCVFVTERAMCVLVIQTSLPLSAPSFKRMTQGMRGRIIIGALLQVMLKPVEDTFGYFTVNHSSFLEVGKSGKTMVLYTSQAPMLWSLQEDSTCPVVQHYARSILVSHLICAGGAEWHVPPKCW